MNETAAAYEKRPSKFKSSDSDQIENSRYTISTPERWVGGENLKSAAEGRRKVQAHATHNTKLQVNARRNACSVNTESDSCCTFTYNFVSW